MFVYMFASVCLYLHTDVKCKWQCSGCRCKVRGCVCVYSYSCIGPAYNIPWLLSLYRPVEHIYSTKNTFPTTFIKPPSYIQPNIQATPIPGFHFKNDKHQWWTHTEETNTAGQATQRNTRTGLAGHTHWFLGLTPSSPLYLTCSLSPSFLTFLATHTETL